MIKYIENIDSEEIKEFTSLKNKNLLEQKLMAVESHKVVKKLIESKIVVKKLFLEESYFNENKDLALSANCPIYLAKLETMKSIVGHNLHHGVMAIAQLPSFYPLEQLGEQIIILNGLTSPENVGTIVRTARALGVESLIFDEKTCSPYLRRCIRVSMGNIFRMKIHKTINLSHTIEKLKELGYPIYGTANEQRSIPISGEKLEKKSCAIIGSEGHGMDQIIKDQCDELMKIHVDEYVEHINASAAASIFLYEMSKKS